MVYLIIFYSDISIFIPFLSFILFFCYIKFTMRVLLLGEFSGVNTSIQYFLRSKGHFVEFFAERDGWKDFQGERFFYRFGLRKPFYLCNLVYVVFNLKRLRDYDYVLFLTPNFPGKLYFVFGIYKYILEKNRHVFYFACGSDFGYVQSQRFMEYSPFIHGNAISPVFSRLDRLMFHWFIRRVNKIYSSAPDYALFYRNFDNYFGHKNLPLFIVDNEVSNQVREYKGSGVIKLLHPISRPEFKGTSYIKAALERLKGLDVRIEIIYLEKVPLSELEMELSTTDILIDQCFGFGFGVLAMLGMKHSCIVLTGFRDRESCLFYPGVYNIDPNVDQIYSLLSKLVNKSRMELSVLKKSSKSYLDELEENSVTSIFV